MVTMCVNSEEYGVLKPLGHGKGGYSYLVTDGHGKFVLKQIHHEPCSYYRFGNKLEAERRDYERLVRTGIRMPRLLAVDVDNERILKEYVDGPTVYELILADRMKERYLEQVRGMARQLAPYGLNIDYFPTNFVVQDQKLYYIDFECNDYMEQWNFENWGIRYWGRTPELLEYAALHQ